MRHLVASGEVDARVIAPVPWFPAWAPNFARYAAFAATPQGEIRHGVVVDHPRYLQIPKFGTTSAPALMYLGSVASVERLRAEGFDFDVIDAHYFYPDGIAAVLLGARFDRPVIITGRGTDLNLLPRYPLARRMIVWAAHRAAALIVVCNALKQVLIDLGVPGERVVVLRNGVDLETFRPCDRNVARAKLGFQFPTLLSVGHLVRRKGVDLTIRSLAALPGFRLAVVGDGPEDRALRRLAQVSGVADRIDWFGAVDHRALRPIYSAADALVLASDREGWANVLLEAMACGTPVVATDVWGTREIVTEPAAGMLVAERSPEAIASAVRSLFNRMPSSQATRAFAERFSWQSTTIGQMEIFERVVGGACRGRSQS